MQPVKYVVVSSDFFKGEGIEVQNRWLYHINGSNNEDWQESFQNPSVLNPNDVALFQRQMENVSNNKIYNTGVDSHDKVVDSNDDWCEVEERATRSDDDDDGCKNPT